MVQPMPASAPGRLCRRLRDPDCIIMPSLNQHHLGLLGTGNVVMVSIEAFPRPVVLAGLTQISCFIAGIKPPCQAQLEARHV
jgi:hypothetical protein